jgi:hypothetical protein
MLLLRECSAVAKGEQTCTDGDYCPRRLIYGFQHNQLKSWKELGKLACPSPTCCL